MTKEFFWRDFFKCKNCTSHKCCHGWNSKKNILNYFFLSFFTAEFNFVQTLEIYNFYGFEYWKGSWLYNWKEEGVFWISEQYSKKSCSPLNSEKGLKDVVWNEAKKGRERLKGIRKPQKIMIMLLWLLPGQEVFDYRHHCGFFLVKATNWRILKNKVLKKFHFTRGYKNRLRSKSQ